MAFTQSVGGNKMAGPAEPANYCCFLHFVSRSIMFPSAYSKPFGTVTVSCRTRCEGKCTYPNRLRRRVAIYSIESIASLGLEILVLATLVRYDSGNSESLRKSSPLCGGFCLEGQNIACSNKYSANTHGFIQATETAESPILYYTAEQNPPHFTTNPFF